MDPVWRHIPVCTRVAATRSRTRRLLLQTTTYKKRFSRYEPKAVVSLLVMFAALLVSVTSARITANSRIDQMYYTILPANNTSSPYEAALVIVSGYGIKHEAYISLGRSDVYFLFFMEGKNVLLFSYKYI